MKRHVVVLDVVNVRNVGIAGNINPVVNAIHAKEHLFWVLALIKLELVFLATERLVSRQLDEPDVITFPVFNLSSI